MDYEEPEQEHPLSPHRGDETIRQPGSTTEDVRFEAKEALDRYYADQAENASGVLMRGDNIVLRMQIEGYDTPLLLRLAGDTIIGRRDPTTGIIPDLDLTPYSGYQMGISRRHVTVRIRNKQVEVVDLGSRNGTHLNGHRLEPQQPVPLRDGDEMRLGKIVLRLYLEGI
jgi:pSer/pThr/pTyr-binding forkhead associated (FHA) protein